MPNPTAAHDRVPFAQKMVYGLGAFTNNLLSGAIGSMSIVLNLGLGMNPAAIGVLMAGARFTDAFMDPLMGYLSDHTRTRWGRRRPYIVAGALLAGVIFALMWQMPAGHSQTFYFLFFLAGTQLFYIAYTVYAVPYIALGYELTPDYFERTRIQGYSSLLGQIPWLLLSWSYAFMENKRLFATNVEGARALAIVIGVSALAIGVLPGLFCKEPSYAVPHTRVPSNPAKVFLNDLAGTLRNRHFRKLTAATFLVFNGFTLIAGLGSYVIIFYVCGGDQVAGARYVGLFGTVLSACTFGAIVAVTWLANKIGKQRAFIVSTSLAIAGYVLKWFCYRPASPALIFIPAPLIAFGLGGLFTTVSAMIADVCDEDELKNGRRREGMFGSVYWWVVKLGAALALVLAGHLLNVTGFLQELGAHQSERSLLWMRIFEVGLPVLTYALALLAVTAYDLTPQKVQAIRLQLEARRGKTTRQP